ncbi:putative endonuclease-reverse transcriptase [Trichonephila clavipes]|nr:putative endonuclease-reverse transcriptase [Trichonephila clavipes]
MLSSAYIEKGRNAMECHSELVEALWNNTLPYRTVAHGDKDRSQGAEWSFGPIRNYKNGVRQGDALVCLLFNLALEKVVRDSNINTGGNIFNKSIKLLAFADDIDIIARTPIALRQAIFRERGPQDGTEN